MRRFLMLILVIWPGLAFGLTKVELAEGRYYLIAMPEGVAHPPLILALHGGGGNPRQFARDAGLTDRALAAGFAVVYPAGTSARGPLLVWNAGYCCGAAARDGVDDLGFLDAVVADAGRRFGADGGVFVTGMSNGAMMAQTYGVLRGVRAVASVAGTMDLGRVRPVATVPLLHIHGTADDHVPYDGGRGAQSYTQVDFSSVADVIAAFRRVAGPLSEMRDTVDRADDGMRVDRVQWLDSGGMPQVVLMTVVGGGHHWPGGRRSDRRGATRDIDASVEVMRFFEAHR